MFVNQERSIEESKSSSIYNFMTNPSNRNIKPDENFEIRNRKNELKITFLELTVTDTGIGIPRKDQNSLFKLFGKTSSNHNRNKTG